MFVRDGKMYHIQCREGEVGRYVLLPGDPFRTDKIAAYLNDPVLIAHNREHKIWNGYLSGEKVTVASTGMGCPSTAICMEELIACGADTFIRIGTAGCINTKIRKKDTIGGIITAAVRDEGTTLQYVPAEYPAVADRHLVDALSKAAEKLKYHFDEGITYTKDGFYPYCYPEMSPLEDERRARLRIWEKANVLLTEMEAAAILVIAGIRGLRASGIMAYSDVEYLDQSVNQSIQVACEAIKILIEKEKQQIRL